MSTESRDVIREVVIVGSGPAGYTAAIYAARADLKPLIYEGSVTAGGALMNTTEVENFPGFVDGVMGPDLMESMRNQAKRFGAELVTDDVVAMELEGEIKVITDGSGNVVKAKSVILAMGSAYREIGLENENVYRGAVFLGVRHAMVSSSVIKLLPSLVVEILLLKKPPSSQNLHLKLY
jgi:thioredoxin reductase (NADPH)